MPRTKHTDAPTASQGMKQYLTTCAKSALPHIQAIAEEYAELEPAARMRRYLEDFGDHFEVTRSNVSTSRRNRSAAERILAKLGITPDDEDEPEAPKPSRNSRRTSRRRSGTFEVGDSFTYKGKGGVTTWTILSINRKGVATCDNGSRKAPFKVSTLKALLGKVVNA